MHRRLNVRLLIYTVVGLATAAGVVHLVHSHQMHGNAGQLVQQAERAFADQNFAKAAELLRHYLEYNPDDAGALERYALVLERTVASPQRRAKTLALLEQLVRQQPDRPDLRRRAAQAAIDAGRLHDAIRHLESTLAIADNNAEIETKLGWCQEALGKYAAAVQAFQRAIALAPDQIDSYILLAEVLSRRLDQPDEASKVMEEMVKANPSSWRAFLARGRYHFVRGQVESAAADVHRAWELGPQQDEVLLAAADMSLVQGNLEDARTYVNRGLQLHPKNERLYRSLATLEVRGNHPKEAIACLRNGLRELPGSLALRVDLAELLLEQGQIEEARRLANEVKERNPVGLVDYLDGQLLMQDGLWSEAIEKLQSARVALGPNSEWLSNLWANLGRCYEGVADLELEVLAYRDAVALNPAYLPLRVRYVKALLAIGLPEEAYRELRQLAAAPEPPEQTWTLLARALLDRHHRQPPAMPDWSELNGALKKAAQVVGNEVDVATLRAEQLWLQGDSKTALDLLRKSVAQHPGVPRVWTALAALQVQLWQEPSALETLHQAQEKLGPRLEIEQAMLRFWSSQPWPRASIGLKQVALKVPRLPRDQQVRLLRELAAAMMGSGEAKEAEAALRQLAALLPKDLRSRVALFDMLILQHRAADAAAVLAELRRIEGEDGVQWRAAEAARAVAKARKGDNSELALARRRLAELRQKRGDWGRLALLEASLEEIDGQRDEAMELYRQAIELGERQPALVLRVAQWLVDRQRFLDASQVLRQFESQMALPRDHARLAAEVALHCEEPRRALALARKAVPANRNDYRDLLWLAQVQWLAGQPHDATATLTQATEWAPHNPEVWAALVRHLARTNQPAHMDTVWRDMRKAMPTDRMGIAQALCLEAAGRLVEAEESYKEALAARPDDEVSLRQAAEFYLRTERPGKAVPLLRKLLVAAALSPAELGTWARRQLAIALMHRGDPSDIAEALALVQISGSGTPITQNRARAAVLAKFPGREAEAIHLFEQTLAKQALTAEEQFWLVQVYDAGGEEEKARRQLRTLLATHRDNPRFVAYHLRALLRRGELESARTWLRTFEALEADGDRLMQIRNAYQEAKARG